MKLCFACSQGGHLMEATILADGLSARHDVFFITDADKENGRYKDEGLAYRVHHVRSFLRNPLLVFVTAFLMFRILKKERPDVLISTGAEVAIPAFFVAKYLFRLPVIYVECCNQVFSPSMTGRITYHMADMFLVQWEPLLKCYGPKAQHKGSFV